MCDSQTDSRHDPDPRETQEWLDSLDDVLFRWGPERARALLAQLGARLAARGLGAAGVASTPLNTILPEAQPDYPGDLEVEERIEALLRWNAVAQVTRANHHVPGLGGHLSTYASSATILETCFNHIWRAPTDTHAGDQIFFQGHASPGIYARAFLEGRLSEADLDGFRQEVSRGGIPSYPHPWLMPNFWQFPTVSMGLGALAAIYQARFNRYLHERGMSDTSQSRVFSILGDGEMDEPESLGALTVARRERLDNLFFLVNCNLQRLDGPVRGNGSIVQELEGVFRGAGWRVLKCLWDSNWDDLFARDEQGLLARRLGEMVDGELQRINVEGGAYAREHLFDSPELKALVEGISDEDLGKLGRGGHDRRKVFAALHEATSNVEPGRPTVILFQTVKGYGLGGPAEGKNVAHQHKSLKGDDLAAFRERFGIEAQPDGDLMPLVHPGPDSPEVKYLQERREALGGHVPTRSVRAGKQQAPGLDAFEEFMGGSGDREASTTMAVVRMMARLLRDQETGKLLVPIIPDEARTFGMDALFRQYGIYAPEGQLYEPHDKKTVMYYRESQDGQILEEGITEAGAMASFTAAGTAYATHGVNCVPMYTFYSMFGFQRTQDSIWAAADQRARGFLFGATAGRTTLNGEGLQHEDGHSHLLASTVPSVRAYDPAYAYEAAVVIQDGLRRMLEEQEPRIYYVTLYNDNYVMPAKPEGEDVPAQILRGMYPLKRGGGDRAKAPQLFGSGPILPLVLEAQRILAADYGVEADVWSVTSYSELRRDALAAERRQRLHPDQAAAPCFVAQQLEGLEGPFIASSDYMKAVADQIRPWVPGSYTTLGTDGFGRSDSREALRRHFEVDAAHVVYATLVALSQRGDLPVAKVLEARERLGIDPEQIDPVVA